ncbi:hypothetical protein A4X06_0g7144 [Tilletia controversa]|uniref:Uncharacterized protein n=1 Tax=Tilletia controversa TaxID=13291 RepID=A0A8X7MMF9_9BASI|nr:hypothetical protein A4X06_0g7144 [Tilletia controversa]
MEFKRFQLTRHCWALSASAEGEREIYGNPVLVEPEAIVYGRIRLPLCKAVFPVLSKTDTLENEVRLLQLGLQDAAEQGRERGVQLADAVQHSETLQAKAARREEDLKRSQGTVVELQSTLDRVQAELLQNQGQLFDFQVRLENSEQRAAEQKRVLDQVRAEAAQKRVESDDVVAELQKILEWVEFATKRCKQRGARTWRSERKSSSQPSTRMRRSREPPGATAGNLPAAIVLAQLNHAARSSNAMDIHTETKQARPSTGSQVFKSDSDRIQELDRLLAEAKAENERLEAEWSAAVEESEGNEFLLKQAKTRLEGYAKENPELAGSLKKAKDEVDRQRKIVNGLEDEVQKWRSDSRQRFSGYQELDQLRGELYASGVDKEKLGRQVDNLRGILERKERELQTVRSNRDYSASGLRSQESSRIAYRVLIWLCASGVNSQ